MVIRSIEPGDWPAFFPVFHDIVEAGETYAYPLGLTAEQAWGLWVEGPPGVCAVAADESGAVLGSAKSGPNRPGPREPRGHGILHGVARGPRAWRRSPAR